MEEKLNIKDTVKNLESKTGFHCKKANYDLRQKEVSKFLNQWGEGRNASLVYDWHREVISPEKKGKKQVESFYQKSKCEECQRYKCKHMTFKNLRPSTAATSVQSMV